jgi:hypothetical protein
MNIISENLPENGHNRQKGLSLTGKIAAGFTLAAAAIIGSEQFSAEQPKAELNKPIAGLKEKKEREVSLPITKEEIEAAKQIVIERVQLETYENVMNTVGVQCGDGRNPEGIPAFGGELMGIAYPVLKQIEIDEKRELTDQEIKGFFDHYPNILVMHTDTHGLEHLVEEMKGDRLLGPLFTGEQLQDIIENGLLTNRVEKLLEMDEDHKIENAIVDIAGHLHCQGCGHVKTVFNEEHKGEAPEKLKKHLSDRMLQENTRRYLHKSPKNKVVRYPGEHTEDKVVRLKTPWDLKSKTDPVPKLTSAGKNRSAFWIDDQVSDFGMDTIIDYADEQFPHSKIRQDKFGFKHRAKALRKKEEEETARRLAPGFPVVDATVVGNGDVRVEAAGRIPGKAANK